MKRQDAGHKKLLPLRQGKLLGWTSVACGGRDTMKSQPSETKEWKQQRHTCTHSRRIHLQDVICLLPLGQCPMHVALSEEHPPSFQVPCFAIATKE